MTSIGKKRPGRVPDEGEVFGLAFMAVLLIVLAAFCVYRLNHIQLPDRSFAQSGFLVLPPWHRKPRLEVILLLTIAAGMLFSAHRGLRDLWWSTIGNPHSGAVKSVRHRLSAAASATALAGLNLALAKWLAR
jgi:hypothetical protein